MTQQQAEHANEATGAIYKWVGAGFLIAGCVYIVLVTWCWAQGSCGCPQMEKDFANTSPPACLLCSPCFLSVPLHYRPLCLHVSIAICIFFITGIVLLIMSASHGNGFYCGCGSCNGGHSATAAAQDTVRPLIDISTTQAAQNIRIEHVAVTDGFSQGRNVLIPHEI